MDWETIEVVPKWKTSRIPSFLTDLMHVEKSNDKEPRIPTPAEYDEEGDDYNVVAAERRDRWENRILRKHYDDTLNRVVGETDFFNYESDVAKKMREFEEQIKDITGDPDWARTWLQRYEKTQRMDSTD